MNRVSGALFRLPSLHTLTRFLIRLRKTDNHDDQQPVHPLIPNYHLESDSLDDGQRSILVPLTDVSRLEPPIGSEGLTENRH